MDNNMNYQQFQQPIKEKRNPIVIVLIIVLVLGNIALGTILFLNTKKLNDKIDEKQSSCDNIQKQYDNLLSENLQLDTDYEKLKEENEELQAQIEELTNPKTDLEESEESGELSEELNTFVNSNMEDVSMFKSDVSYDEIARHPNDYDGELLSFSGEVAQVIEGEGTTELRIAVDGDYDNIIYGIYDNRILDSRLLEDDKIQFYGESCGIISYQSTLGATISIPSMSIYKIVIK
nr:MAG TPA: Homeobox associated leucine zipper [Caudoviricetes sp.]